MSAKYCDHRIATKPNTGDLDASFQSLGELPNVALQQLRYGAGVEITPEPLDTFYIVETPLEGGIQGRIGPYDVSSRPGMATIVSPTMRTVSRWFPASTQLMLRVERRSMERALSAMIMAPVSKPLEFHATFDLSSAHGASFARLLDYLAAELSSSDAIGQSRLIAAHLEDALLTTLLLGQAHTYSDRLSAQAGTACPRHVARAYNHMLAHADEPLTIADLVEVSGVSARTLYDGFQRFKGASPMGCLRAVRMERVRDELLAGGERKEVSAVANKWGFLHLGRFAQSYQALFGERPSDTVRRRA